MANLLCYSHSRLVDSSTYAFARRIAQSILFRSPESVIPIFEMYFVVAVALRSFLSRANAFRDVQYEDAENEVFRYKGGVPRIFIQGRLRDLKEYVVFYERYSVIIVYFREFPKFLRQGSLVQLGSFSEIETRSIVKSVLI